eukprot:c29817_g1_i1 orf=329-481(+)
MNLTPVNMANIESIHSNTLSSLLLHRAQKVYCCTKFFIIEERLSQLFKDL